MKVLLLGARGQLGRCLQDRIRRVPELVLAAHGVDTLDLTDGKAVAVELDRFDPAIVINAAAYTAVDKAENDRAAAFAVNAEAPAELARACAARGTIMLHVSTDYVFDGSAAAPYTETDAPAPLGVYGASKLAGEKAVLAASDRHVVLRTAWVFSEYGTNFLKTMLSLADKESIDVVSDQCGSPTYAGDLADALLVVARSGPHRPGGLFHFGGEPAASRFEFASALFEYAQASGAIVRAPTLNAVETDAYPTPARRPAWSVLSSDKLSRTYGVERSDWRRAVAMVIDRLQESDRTTVH